ncbi:MAG: hypothetical protein H6621_01935 [Halobacteriovoraceae bacterium]|nr:hypothetical protein [Halobacteriovoraceae bacterium]MCB9093802.1 hypothetical protein [Halobacteriovoraceae bacterium]
MKKLFVFLTFCLFSVFGHANIDGLQSSVLINFYKNIKVLKPLSLDGSACKISHDAPASIKNEVIKLKKNSQTSQLSDYELIDVISESEKIDDYYMHIGEQISRSLPNVDDMRSILYNIYCFEYGKSSKVVQKQRDILFNSYQDLEKDPFIRTFVYYKDGADSDDDVSHLNVYIYDERYSEVYVMRGTE